MDGTNLSNKVKRYPMEILAEIALDILPESIKKNGKGREYLEKRMLEQWFADLTKHEKVLLRSLTKAVLDRAFPT